MIKYVVQSRLDGMNELILANRGNKYAGATLKKENQEIVAWYVKAQGVEKAPKPCDIHIRWYEPNRRRDKDNITTGKKFILDALVEVGVLQNDGWNDIGKLSDEVFLDRETPRIEIYIRKGQ